VGFAVGATVGFCVGTSVGLAVGRREGAALGFALGTTMQVFTTAENCPPFLRLTVLVPQTFGTTPLP
jgi:hypothetical protein